MTGPTPPHFVRFTLDGETAVHPGNSGRIFSAEQALACEGLELRVRICDRAEFLGPELTARRAAFGLPEVSSRSMRGEFSIVSLRVGSKGKKRGEPEWLVVPVRLHRPLPAGATIKWAWLQRETRGYTEARHHRWRIGFTLHLPQPAQAPVILTRKRAVAIDLGWRIMPDGGIRVAYFYDDTGKGDGIVCPAGVVKKFAYCDAARGIADRNYELARGIIKQQIDAVGEWPEWLIKAGARTLARWKSPEALRRLVGQIREHRNNALIGAAATILTDVSSANMILHLHPDDLERDLGRRLRDRTAALPPRPDKTVRFCADPKVARSGCVIYTDASSIDVRIPAESAWLDEITKKLDRFHDPRPGDFGANMELARSLVADHLHKVPVQDWPEWVKRAEAEHIQSWKSSSRLRRFLIDLRAKRMPGDEKLIESIDLLTRPVAWDEQDLHLRRDLDANQRDRAQRLRLEIYRRFAYMIATTYDLIVLEDLDLTSFAKYKSPEEGAKTEDAETRKLRTLAAPSILRTWVKNTAHREGKEVKLVNPAYTSRNCPKCGHQNAGSSELYVTCEKCFNRDDQDRWAGANLLKAAV